MKNLSLVIILICLLTTAIFASVKYFQNNMDPKNTWLGYEKEWQKVDSLESAGLPKSALEIVEEILVFAEAEKMRLKQLSHLLINRNTLFNWKRMVKKP
ncbi:MAG: hypothetical protein IPH42_13125 [Bacteroidetes bacterium]|nr:hypothetical protein [Bacteroidota bacterium]